MSREQLVRDTAYAIWEAEGRPTGRDAEHWKQAEDQVAAAESGSAGTKRKAAASPVARATPPAKPGATSPRAKRSSKTG